MFKPHYPPHRYQDEAIYFITSRTVSKKRYFNTDIKKQIIKKAINEAKERFKVSFFAWVILDNHYHLLTKILKGALLPAFMQVINGKSAFLLNKLEKVKKRKIWFNYWDYCIRNEADFWKHFNYIHHNPVKHNYITNQSLVANYPFCSYSQWLKKEGQAWLNSCFKQHPIIDFTVQGDEL